jgi:hypothetical protein
MRRAYGDVKPAVGSSLPGRWSAWWRRSASQLMLVVYVGFILLIAFNKPLLGRTLTDGTSLASCSVSRAS